MDSSPSDSFVLLCHHLVAIEQRLDALLQRLDALIQLSSAHVGPFNQFKAFFTSPPDVFK